MGHGYSDQQSTYSYMNSLKQQPDILDQVKSGLGELARQADQDQPVGRALADEIQRAADEVSAVYQESLAWYGMCRTDARNRRDGDRVTHPRKSARVERNADAGAAIRDV
jgi:hypothetical protein